MQIFTRYVFRQAFGATLLILLSLTGVVWIAVALRQLNLVTTQGQTAWTFFKMTTLALPNLMAIIAPIALLIAVIHCLNRLNGDSELIVMTASGATVWRVGRPLILLAIVIGALVGLVNHVVQPWSLRALRDAVIEMRADLIGQVVQPGKFSSPESGLTFHIRDRALNGDLQGLLLHDSRDPKQVTSYIAERGVITSDGANSFLFMQNGHILRRQSAAEPVQIVRFESYAVDLARFERKQQHVELKPRERFFSELAFPSPDDPDFKRQPGHFRAELHERFASPLYPLAFVLIALAAVGQAQSTRQKRMQPLIIGFLAAASLRLAGLAANNLVVVSAIWTPLLYGLPLAGVAIAGGFVWWNARPRAGISRWDRATIAVEDAFAALKARLWPARPHSPARPAAGE